MITGGKQEIDDVKRRETSPTASEQILIKFFDHLLAGIEDISGHWGQYYWKDKLEYFNSRYLQSLLGEYDHPTSNIKEALYLFVKSLRENVPLSWQKQAKHIRNKQCHYQMKEN
ncbi:PREDICTED: sodium/hydrogen exchanger 2-like isoform X1 [Cercocebus atys]|uniref:sodium/hydrogen exchanger 2-like isoform X1 n=1 Tax=Cercocebus atys TaxID=9531 RepID=UPI0005F5015C|nr:PREDICTED: sodium/hydrogen exchanger 2-like isoform X1 [Cercocebus atys]